MEFIICSKEGGPVLEEYLDVVTAE